MPRRSDIDALLEEDSLVLKLGGKEYVVRDIPVKVAVKAQQIEGEGIEVARAYMRIVLPEMTDDEFEALGMKALHLAMREMNAFLSETTAAMEAEAGAAEAAVAASTGPTPSEPSSAPTADTN